MSKTCQFQRGSFPNFAYCWSVLDYSVSPSLILSHTSYIVVSFSGGNELFQAVRQTLGASIEALVKAVLPYKLRSRYDIQGDRVIFSVGLAQVDYCCCRCFRGDDIDEA